MPGNQQQEWDGDNFPYDEMWRISGFFQVCLLKVNRMKYTERIIFTKNYAVAVASEYFSLSAYFSPKILQTSEIQIKAKKQWW